MYVLRRLNDLDCPRGSLENQLVFVLQDRMPVVLQTATRPHTAPFTMCFPPSNCSHTMCSTFIHLHTLQ